MLGWIPSQEAKSLVYWMSQWEVEGSEEEKQGRSHEDKWSGKSGNLILFFSGKHTAFLCHLKNIKYILCTYIV